MNKLWSATQENDLLTCINVLKLNGDNAEALLNESNEEGWTPLHIAANEGCLDLVDLFLRFGSIVDPRLKNFQTPLHLACKSNNLEIVQSLILSGSDVNSKDIEGNTPSHICAFEGHIDCLRFLLNHSPSLFAKNKWGLIPQDCALNQ